MTQIHTHAKIKKKYITALPFLAVLHTSFILLLIPYKMQTRCPFTSHHCCSTYLPLSFYLSLLPFLLSLHPWAAAAAVTPRDTSACLLWYSGIRFAWSPRSGTNNLFNPLIIIRGINKFWDGRLHLEPWTFTLGWNLSFYRFSYPVDWWQKAVSSSASLPLPLLWSKCAMNPLTGLDGSCQSTYAIFRDTVSVLANVYFNYSVRQGSVYKFVALLLLFLLEHWIEITL